MNKPLSILFGLLVVSGLQACATTAPRIDATQAARITDGAHDRPEIAALFGAPEETEHFRVARGTCTDAWYWSHPTRATYENLTVYFDARGVVCGHGYSGPNQPRAALVHDRVASAGAARRASRF